jgi:hypothetical protein
VGVLSQLRVAAAAHPEPAAPRLARASETGQARAFTIILMILTALALWWPRLPVCHG